MSLVDEAAPVFRRNVQCWCRRNPIERGARCRPIDFITIIIILVILVLLSIIPILIIAILAVSISISIWRFVFCCCYVRLIFGLTLIIRS